MQTETVITHFLATVKYQNLGYIILVYIQNTSLCNNDNPNPYAKTVFVVCMFNSLSI